MHYICLRNPIETAKQYHTPSQDYNRRKSTTLQQAPKIQTPLRNIIEEEDERNSDILNTRKFIKGRDKHNTTDRSSTIQSMSRGHQKPKAIILFKFTSNISK
jgi:hypothetical protein